MWVLVAILLAQPPNFESVHKLSLNEFWEGVKVVDDSLIFRYFLPDAHEVYFVGDLNGFDTTAGRMERDANGAFRIAFKFAPGCYRYKLIVDGQPMLDPTHKAILHCIWDKFSFFCVSPDRRLSFKLTLTQRFRMCLK